MRGTPILLQLFVLYYGIAAAIRLPAFVAALLGLALNYAAYESEIYRGGARSGLGRPARGGAHARAERAPGPDARPRAAGVPARARADDQRLRRAAQGLVARVGAHRPRADEADADLRDQSRQLGDSGTLCAALYLAMSLPLAALARRLERRWKAAARMTPGPRACAAFACAAARQILDGVSFEVGRGELVAIMGPSGSGKTTILRAIAGLEALSGRPDRCGRREARRRRDDRGRPTLRALRRKVGMVFQFHCLFEHLSAIEQRLPGAGARARRSRRTPPSGARARCSRPSASSIARRRCRASSRAAKRSASPSPARSRSIRRCC